MKSILKVAVIQTFEDVNTIKQAVANNEGVVACEVSKEKKEISVVYDNHFLKIDAIIDSIEELGYIIL